MLLPSHNVPLTLVADIIYYLGRCPNAEFNEICNFVGYGDSYVRSGMTIARILNIYVSDPNSEWEYITNEAKSMLGSAPSDVMKLTVMRKYIQQCEPFTQFVQFCICGDPKPVSARKVYVLYNFKGKSTDFLCELFTTWGKSTGIFTVEGQDSIILSEKIGVDLNNHNNLDIQLDDDMAIRLYVSGRLGAEVFSYMQSAEIDELTEAFKKSAIDPRGAIECAGRAFEDFLRRVSQKVGVDVTGKTGIGQVINTLYNNRDATGKLDNKVHSKQLSIGNAIADMRNMAGHSLEAKTMERWNLEIKSGQTYIELVLSTIKSIFKYTDGQSYLF